MNSDRDRVGNNVFRASMVLMALWHEFRLKVADALNNAVAEIFPAQSSNPAALGDRGEQEAERFLKKRRLRIIERGYRNHVGEIDLIAVDQKSRPRTIVFVEVKTRQSDNKGLPVEAVDDRKQRQISQTAMVYLKQHELLECRFRFDIVGIIWPDLNQKPEITHYVNAFEPVGTGQLFN